MAAMAKMWKIRLSAGDWMKKSEISYGCKSLILNKIEKGGKNN